MKKKFLLYVAVIVTVLFLGFTVYYIARNDETISLTISKEDSVYINKQESFALPIEWTKPYKDTKMEVLIGDQNVLSYSQESKMFTGTKGGFTTVTITTNNKNFGPFVFEVYVGDGEANSPFMLKSAEELAKIGTDTTFTSQKHYALSNDIDLATYNNGIWAPLETFSGSFNGNGHIIYNLNIENSTEGGLFKKVTASGVVENVKFADVNITGEYDYVGTVAGINSGLVGKVEVISGQITNNKAGGFTGGVVGFNKYDSNPAYVNMCSSNLSLSGTGVVGGLVGHNLSSVVLNSASVVNNINCLSADTVFGGIVGLNASTYSTQLDKYYPSAIVKSYAVVDAVSGQQANCGVVIGNNTDNNNNNSIFYNVFESVIYAQESSIGLSPVAMGSNLISFNVASQIISKSKQDLLNQATYVNYNFENVWNKQSTGYATLNFLGSYETVYIKGMGNEVTFSDFGLVEYLEHLKTNNALSNVSTYTISVSDILPDTNGQRIVECDLGGKSWQTLAPNSAEPFRVSIIVEDGVIVKIKNFKLEAGNSSFFGYVSGNTIIQNIIFENVIVNNAASDETGVVTTSLQGAATLKNIQVNNVLEFTTKAKRVGIISGSNNANIINASVSMTVPAVIYAASEQVHAGGITGANQGLILNSTIENLTMEVNTSIVSNGNINIGGIAGLATSSIKNCAVKSFNLSTTNTGIMHVGGVVGYTTAGNIEIYKCYSKANISLSMLSENVYLAGIAAHIADGTTVYGCAYTSGTLKAYNVAGLVGINNGTITVSYSEGTLNGNRVGGLTNLCYKNIQNCYTLSTLVGNNKDSVVSGITGFVGPECLIDKCFSSATFTGEGDFYAESESPFRTLAIVRAVYKATGNYDFGTVSNLIIINYGEATKQSSIFGIRRSWIDVTEEDCRGKNDYAVLRDKASFDSSIWDFGNIGQYPKLKDAVVVG